MAKAFPLSPRQRVLLTYLALGEQEMDPIRIMKGLFIYCQESPLEWTDGRRLYSFEPYNWGPVSFDVYRDLDLLRALGLVSTREHPGATWKYYQVTSRGRTLADEIKKGLDPKAVKYLGTIRQFTLSVGFYDLLRAVYKKYPKYAVNSVFKF